MRLNSTLARGAMIVLSNLAASPSLAQLTYAESSNGLQTPTMEGGRTELEFSDVNADGHVDLISVGDHGSPKINSPQQGVMVWFGDGAGNWSVFQTGNFGYGGCALGDVNGDGKMDIGYGVHHNYSSNDLGDQILEVALGDGTGKAWTPWDDGLATNGEDWGMFGCDFADVDRDGDLDLGSISFGCCAGLHVYLNNDDGTWTQSWGFLGGNSSQEFTFGDVNGDGYVDFAASHGSGTVYFGDGNGGFTLADAGLGGPLWRRGVSLGDVNNDGRDDLSFFANGAANVWSWVGPGQWQNLSAGLPATGVLSTQIADMNLDGQGDVVCYTNAAITVYAGNGAGGWQLAATIPTKPNTCGFSALRVGADFDHNGYPDFAYVSEENCQPFTGGTNRPRAYREGSTPTAQFVFPVAPVGGRKWHAGTVQFIDWHAAVLPGAGAGTMTLELSTAGPNGPWQTIASNVPNNGRYQWKLPKNLPTSSNCVIRYTLTTSAGSVSATTPSAFTILGSAGGIPGDLNGDGKVDQQDLGILLAAYGTCLGQPGYNPVADIDGNGCVDQADLGVLLANWTG